MSANRGKVDVTGTRAKVCKWTQSGHGGVADAAFGQTPLERLRYGE